MGITQPPAPTTTARLAPAGRAEAFITGGAYAMLFLAGLAAGVISSFEYGRAVIGPVPVGALACCVVIFLGCGLGGWAMRGVPGALLPAIGWFVASFGLAMPATGGSVIIANTSAGEWYLYGGSVAALLGVGSALVTSVRALR